jgi:predicted metalloprotease
MRYLITPFSLVVRLGSPPPPVERAERFANQWSEATIEDLIEVLDALHKEFEARWDVWFWKHRRPHMQPMFYRYLRDGEALDVECTDEGETIPITADTTNAFYCPRDETVYIPIEPLRRVLKGHIWSENYPLRDQEPAVAEHLLLFAITLIAHECGHGLQRAWELKSHNPAPEEAISRERFADCIAGDFIAQVDDRICLSSSEEGLTEAIRTLGFAAIGDVIPPEGAGGDPQQRNELIDHGFAEQRRAIFEIGYSAGKTSPLVPDDTCFNRYWGGWNSP